jgi:hypothetical protein
MAMNQDLEKTLNLLESKSPRPVNPEEKTIRVNESLGAAAFFYEKLRNALEYQDEHLFLKNAIKRILKRKALLEMPDTAKKLLHELVWARYFENSTLPESYIEDVDQILRKNKFVREAARSTKNPISTSSYLLGLAACEIEEFLNPPSAKKEFFRFAKKLIMSNIQLGDEMAVRDLEVQVDISIEKLLFKSDLEQIRFRLMSYFYPDWPVIDKKEAMHLGKFFARVSGQIDSWINENNNSKIFKYVKKNIAPLVVLWEIIAQDKVHAALDFHDSETLRQRAAALIESRNQESYKKVIRALVRAIIFIFATKTVLAFVLEVPYELEFFGSLNYTALVINIILPPTLMVVSGLFIRVPGPKNTNRLLKMINSAVFEDTLLGDPLLSLKTTRNRGYLVFNFFYSILSAAILALVIWALIALDFNIVSVILFYVFISLVSFLAFRIRSKARELEVAQTEDSVLGGVLNFLISPFVVIGRFLSDKWSDYNFTLLFWDFIIEAPLKTIMSVFEAWLAFSREKREDFE